jgi:enterochelin esterase-like enzyme
MKQMPILLMLGLMNLIASINNSNAQIPVPKTGTIERIENFSSSFVTPRKVDVWLPEGFSYHKKYAVLYMHDGQMLYDSAITWNKQSWNVDDVIDTLVKQHLIRDVIVVGIWNGGATRHQDYFPQKPFEALTEIEQDTVTSQLQRGGKIKEKFKPVSDNYLKFLVQELKPLIDKKYPTYTNQKNTFIAGSSMGGLISMYAICEYPQVFGGAACISTHWPGTFTLASNPMPDAFLQYLSSNLPATQNHKIYFDCGDQTLDAMYPSIQKKVDALMQSKGFNEKHWLTKFFPGENHSEQAWNKRLHIPLEFLLKK